MAIIKLDKEREIKLTTGAMRRFKEMTGKNIMQMDKLNELEPFELTQLIFCCLDPKPDITVEELEEYIELKDFPAIMTSMVGERKGDEAKDPLSVGGQQ